MTKWRPTPAIQQVGRTDKTRSSKRIRRFASILLIAVILAVIAIVFALATHYQLMFLQRNLLPRVSFDTVVEVDSSRANMSNNDVHFVII